MTVSEFSEREMGAPNRFGLECQANGEQFSAVYQAPASSCGSPAPGYKQYSTCGLSHEADLAYDHATAIWRRSDKLVNESDRVIKVSNPKLKFYLRGNRFSITAQRSSWCKEAQEERLDARCDEAVIGSRGRTCSGYIPHFTVSAEAGSYAFDLLPCGDWRAKFKECPESDCLEIELDRFEEDMLVELSPGESFELSLDCLVRRLDSYDAGEGGHIIQTYAMRNTNGRRQRVLPVVYNTWFDRFDKISLESLEAQLNAACKVGCEAFVIDAGWYGTETTDWNVVGDWREDPSVFSERTLRDFADHVRSKGLDFGLWIEPERVHTDAQIRRERPNLFIAADLPGYYYPDLCKPEAREWVLSEMVRAIETYELRWLKVDCNFDFSNDPDKLGHRNRLRAWYEILDEVARRFPDLVVEGCASGGLRSDLLTISHFDTHFLSDTVDPIDVLRITASSLGRLAPRMTSKWIVAYPTGNGWTPYGNEGLDTGDLILCPLDAANSRVASYHVVFAAHAAMTGVMGVSGNIAGLGDDVLDQLARHIAFYKQHREFIQSSVGIPLTPVEPIDKRDGVVAIQLSDEAFHRSMVFVYNISSGAQRHLIKPAKLDAHRQYRITDENGLLLCGTIEGSHLQNGWEVECAIGRSRVIFVETAKSDPQRQYITPQRSLEICDKR